jgi:hypothetical protein
MKALFITMGLFILPYSLFASAPPLASVSLHPSASVLGDTFSLGDIATITSTDTAFRARLMSAPMGRAPLAGLSRDFNEGDVSLKLRQAGIDPERLSISGPSDILVVGAGGLSPTMVVLPVPMAAAAAATKGVQAVSTLPAVPKGILVHRGDKITLVYESTGLSISADVTATSDGAAGDTVSLQRDGAARSLTGIVVDARTAKMME